MQLLRQQRVTVQVEPGITVAPDALPLPLARAWRAHARLTFPERLARNVRTRVAGLVTVTLFGVPDVVAQVVGLPILSQHAPQRGVVSSWLSKRPAFPENSRALFSVGNLGARRGKNA
jgi:hypothetical protein